MAAEATTTTLTATSGIPEKITNAQTVCNRRNEKNKLCNGHIKQLSTGGEEATKHLRGDDVLFKCQSCGTLYMGPPLGHVRDIDKQQRFVEKELMAILKSAGGTLPAIKKNEKGVFVLAEVTAQHAPAPAAAKPAATQAAPAAKPAAAQPAPTAKSPSETEFGPIPGASGPVPGETPEQKIARLKAVVAEAKRRKALLGDDEAGAAAAPAAARPAATPKPAAPAAASTAPAAEATQPAPAAADLGPIPGASGPVPGETPEQKIARLQAVVAEAKRRKALLGGDEAAAGAAQPAARTTPTAATTSGTNSSAQADAHRPAAEAQAATGMASAAPLSPAAATASPVAGPESPADLAPDTVESSAQASNKDLGPIPGASGPVPGETHEEKIARLQAVVAEAKRRKALLGGE